MKALDVERVRQHFPAFAAASDSDNEWSFFENAGGTLPVKYVVDRLHSFYSHHKVQPYGYAPMQAQAGSDMDEGRARMAQMLGLDVDDVILGPSTTQNFNTLATGFTGLLESGDEIIVSEQDHEANIGAWLRAAKLAGASAIFWQANPQTGELELDELVKLVNQRTRLVSLTHSSNIIGSINPLAEIAELLKNSSQQKIFLIADGVSYAPHGLPAIDQLAASGVDAYCFSTYKTFGTHMGVMYIHPELSALLTPQCHYFNTGKRQARFDSAGPDHASIAALAGIADYFEKLYAEHEGAAGQTVAQQVSACSRAIKDYEHQLAQPVLDCLQRKDVRIFGQTSMSKSREANVAFSTSGKTSASINEGLAKHRIASSNGHFYAPRVLTRMGCEDIEDGVVRLSFAHYNNQADVEQLMDALDDILPPR